MSFLVLLLALAADKPADADYFKGLEAMEKGDFAAAIAALAKAAEADDENAAYLTARGVALALAEKFPQAVAGLERSLRLRPGHRETRLWLACAYRMGGDPGKGAMHFVHGGDVPVAYASFVYNEMAMEYWRGKGRAKFARAGELFARRALGDRKGPDLGLNLFDRALSRMEKKDYAGAAADLEAVLATKPDQPEVLMQLSLCRLETGDADGPRRLLTRLLVQKPGNAEAWLARGLAQARAGRLAESLKDIRAGAALDEKAADAFKEKHAAELAAVVRTQPKEKPAELLASLVAAAREGKTDKELVEIAVALRRAANAVRNEGEERFVRELAAEEAAASELPGNAAAQLKIAGVLYSFSLLWQERVEPRGPYRLFPLSSVADRDAHLRRALAICDKVLAGDDEHPQALRLKALVQRRISGSAARPVIDKLVEVGSDDPDVALMAHEAAMSDARARRAEAHKLRNPEFGSASKLELEDADKLDAEAKAMLRDGEARIAKAAKAHEGKAEGLLALAVLHRLRGEADAEREAVEKAVKLAPENAEALRRLASIQYHAKQQAEGLETFARMQQLAQTTAGPYLEQVWPHVKATRWSSARKAADRALELDPADARGLAYAAMAAVGQEKASEAVALLRAALAAEEARARHSGTTFQAAGKGAVAASDIGLTLQLRLVLADLSPKGGAALCRANVALAERVPAAQRTRPIYGAQLPDPSGQAGEVPMAWSLAEGLAWSRLGAGRLGGSRADLEAVVVLARDTRFFSAPGAEPMRTLDAPKAFAAIELARLHWRSGDAAGARRWLNQAGSWDKRAEAARKALEAEMRGMRR